APELGASPPLRSAIPKRGTGSCERGESVRGEILEPGKAWDDLRFSRPTRTHEGVQPRAKAMNGPQADAAAMPSSSEGGSIVPPMQHALNVTCKAVLRLSKLLRNKETASRKWEEYTAQMKQQVIKERQKFERDMEKLTSDIRMQSRTGARAATVSEQVVPMELELELADDPYHLPAPPAAPTPPGLPLSGDSRLPAQSRARGFASLSEAPRQPIMESSKHMPTPVLGRRGLGEKLQDRRLAEKQLEDDGTGQACSEQFPLFGAKDEILAVSFLHCFQTVGQTGAPGAFDDHREAIEGGVVALFDFVPEQQGHVQGVALEGIGVAHLPPEGPTVSAALLAALRSGEWADDASSRRHCVCCVACPAFPLLSLLGPFLMSSEDVGPLPTVAVTVISLD
ncbi:unnamed protein product, partial [Symbiodinium microadriaticum]